MTANEKNENSDEMKDNPGERIYSGYYVGKNSCV